MPPKPGNTPADNPLDNILTRGKLRFLKPLSGVRSRSKTITWPTFEVVIGWTAPIAPGSFRVTLDGVDISAQFSSNDPNATQASAYISTTHGDHTLTATANVQVERPDLLGKKYFQTSTSICVTTWDFDAAIFPSSLALQRGQSGTVQFQITPHNGFNGQLRFWAENLPQGVTITPAQFRPGYTTATMKIQLAPNAVRTSSEIAIKVGSSLSYAWMNDRERKIEKSLLLLLTVRDFNFSIEPSGLEIKRGELKSAKAIIIPMGGFTGPVRISPTNLPANITCSSISIPIPSGSYQAEGTLDIFVGDQATVGDHYITFEGRGNNLSIHRNQQPLITIPSEIIPPIQKPTMFSPTIHGFKFQNDGFKNDYIPEFEIRTDALCGGMAYAALDYYYANKPIPKQPFRPAVQTPLRTYIYNRQVASIENNLDKWGDFLFGNLFGVRDTEYFNWGISGHIKELRYFLDRGIPCVICLMGGGGWGHQVVAYGYTMGRYQGNLGPYVEDFKIYVYDPNYPEPAQTIVADPARHVFRREGPGVDAGDWRTYFVDSKYCAQIPPTIPDPIYPDDGLVHELILEFVTGGVYLHGGSDKNVDLIVKLTDSTQQVFPNINLSGRWVVGSSEFAQVILQKPVPKEALKELTLTCGDNWEMATLRVHTLGGNDYEYSVTGGPMLFTGPGSSLVVPFTPEPSLGLKGIVHLQGIGDMELKQNEFAGTRGHGVRLEGFQIELEPHVSGLTLQYFAHVEGIGDTAWVPQGQFVGTRNQNLRLEGFAMKLIGPRAIGYEIEYMAHIQNKGDVPFVKNGEFCGTRGQGLQVEGILVRVNKKK
jgi:hypothetical protein